MSSSPTAVRPLLHAALAAALLLASAPRAAAAEGALELSYGPDQTEWLTLRTLRVLLDGAPLQVVVPAKGDDPAKVLVRTPLAVGAHRLEVEAELEGTSTVFTYVGDHRFKMRGLLQLDVLTGDVVGVRAKVVDQPGVTVQWNDRFRLALDATVRRSAVAEVVAAQPEPAPAVAPAAAATAAAPEAAPVPVAVTAPAPSGAPARPACSLEPIHFAFAQAALTSQAQAALDRLAACLAGGARAVRLEGHCDSRGPDVYNEWLGAQRAAAAARHLRERGLAPERITVRSMSAGHPTCTEADAACHARNRRVEAVVLE